MQSTPKRTWLPGMKYRQEDVIKPWNKRKTLPNTRCKTAQVQAQSRLSVNVHGKMKCAYAKSLWSSQTLCHDLSDRRYHWHTSLQGAEPQKTREDGQASPGMETESLASPALAGAFFTISATWKALTSFQFSSVQSLSRVRLFTTP